MKKVMTPFAVAVDLVRHYAERGDDVDQFKAGGLGSYGSDYSASIGGVTRPIEYYNLMEAVEFSDDFQKKVEQHMAILDRCPSKRYPNTKIVVETINGKPVNEVFDLYEVWNYILQENRQTKLF